MPVTGVFIWDMARTAETEPAKKFVACLDCMLHIVYIRHSVIRWAVDPGSLNQSSPVSVYSPGAEGEKMAQEGRFVRRTSIFWTHLCNYLHLLP